MKNITVSVPEDVYHCARVKAAERKTSVSGMVREFLVSLAETESDFDRRKRLQAETIAGVRGFRAGGRLTREQVHDRHALR